jgi:hypothetical protein
MGRSCRLDSNGPVSKDVGEAKAANAEGANAKEFAARETIAQRLLFLSPDREHGSRLP